MRRQQYSQPQIARKDLSLDLLIVVLACLLEKHSNMIHVSGEPELPQGYRHIRSAIGAVLTIGRDCAF